MAPDVATSFKTTGESGARARLASACSGNSILLWPHCDPNRSRGVITSLPENRHPFWHRAASNCRRGGEVQLLTPQAA